MYYISHPFTDIIQWYSSLDWIDQGVTYNWDDVIYNDSEFEDMKNRVIIWFWRGGVGWGRTRSAKSERKNRW